MCFKTVAGVWMHLSMTPDWHLVPKTDSEHIYDTLREELNTQFSARTQISFSGSSEIFTLAE